MVKFKFFVYIYIYVSPPMALLNASLILRSQGLAHISLKLYVTILDSIDVKQICHQLISVNERRRHVFGSFTQWTLSCCVGHQQSMSVAVTVVHVQNKKFQLTDLIEAIVPKLLHNFGERSFTQMSSFMDKNHQVIQCSRSANVSKMLV